jgi:hypothetical protein
MTNARPRTAIHRRDIERNIPPLARDGNWVLPLAPSKREKSVEASGPELLVKLERLPFPSRKKRRRQPLIVLADL